MQNRRIVFQHAAANIAIRFFYRHFAGGAEDLFQRRNRQRGAVNQLLRQFADYRMLVYAIVLILVMLFTNNPACKAFFARFKFVSTTGKEAV